MLRLTFLPNVCPFRSYGRKGRFIAHFSMDSTSPLRMLRSPHWRTCFAISPSTTHWLHVLTASLFVILSRGWTIRQRFWSRPHLRGRERGSSTRTCLGLSPRGNRQMSCTKVQTDAIARAHGVLVTMLPCGWPSIMTEFKTTYGKHLTEERLHIQLCHAAFAERLADGILKSKKG